VDFANLRGLEKEGDSKYRALPEAGAPTPAGAGTVVKQGYVEQSNVNVVHEMVRMIEINRAYEANERAIRAHDTAMATVIAKVIRG